MVSNVIWVLIIALLSFSLALKCIGLGGGEVEVSLGGIRPFRVVGSSKASSLAYVSPRS
jgi:hypothetical protein